MPPFAHRVSPNRARELRERVWHLVEQKLGAGEICGRCRARLSNFDERCTADLGEKCPGFLAMDRAREAAQRQVMGAST